MLAHHKEIDPAVDRELLIILDVELPRSVLLIPVDNNNNTDSSDGVDTGRNSGNNQMEPEKVKESVETAENESTLRFSMLSRASFSFSGTHCETLQKKRQTKFVQTQHNTSSVDKSQHKSESHHNHGHRGVEDGEDDDGDVDDAFGIFMCPLLGPMFRRRFNSVWWDIDAVEATNGVCDNLLQFGYHNNNDATLDAVFKPQSHQNLSHRPSIQLTEQPITFRVTKLSLKISHVGEYVQHDEEDSQKEGLFNKFVKEKKKTNKIVVPKNLSKHSGSFQLVMTNMNYHHLADYISIIDKLGAFRTHKKLFSSKYDLPLLGDYFEEDRNDSSVGHINNNDVLKELKKKRLHQQNSRSSHQAHLDSVVNSYLQTLEKESRLILPYLLTLPAPCDALLLSQSIFAYGPERNAEMASFIVTSLCRQVAINIFARRLSLKIVLDGILESKELLNSVQSKKTEIVRNIEDITKSSRIQSQALISVRDNIDNVNTIFQLSSDFECAKLLTEELNCRLNIIEDLEIRNEHVESCHVENLSNVSTVEWYSFAASFASKPSKEYLDVMLVVMNLMNFTLPLPKVSKLKKEVTQFYFFCVLVLLKIWF